MSDKITSMKNKPIIFTLLTFLCLAEPLMKVLYFKVHTQFDLSIIMGNLLVRNGVREVLDFWLIFPIAGLLIMKLRRWSYFSFMGVLSYIVYNIIFYEKYSWPYYSESPLMYHYVVVGLSSCIFVAFLSPKVREPFFDRRVRLWECMERFPVRVQCSIKDGPNYYQAELLNISRTGAFMTHHGPIGMGENMELSFTYAGMTIELPIEIVHSFPFNQQSGIGVRFQFSSIPQYFRVVRVMRELKLKKHPATALTKVA